MLLLLLPASTLLGTLTVEVHAHQNLYRLPLFLSRSDKALVLTSAEAKAFERFNAKIAQAFNSLSTEEQHLIRAKTAEAVRAVHSGTSSHL